ncbi:hypothetical protein, partial [Vibrio nigripulchritudo]|uniref:hypothetical protein n=1 Tax=Vibrio nigripulchritudo TaxID=28173 RepID=UPI001F3B1D70
LIEIFCLVLKRFSCAISEHLLTVIGINLNLQNTLRKAMPHQCSGSWIIRHSNDGATGRFLGNRLA